MSLYHFRALMWKNFRLKLHRWIVLVLELLLPIGMTGLLFYVLKSNDAYAKLALKEYNEPRPQHADPDEIPISLKNFKNDIKMGLAYAPENPATTEFMELLQKLRQTTSKQMNALANEAELERYLLNFKPTPERDEHTERPIGIYFRNVESGSIPDKFSYVLKHPHSFSHLYDFKFIATQVLMNEVYVDYVNRRKQSGNKRQIRDTRKVRDDDDRFGPEQHRDDTLYVKQLPKAPKQSSKLVVIYVFVSFALAILIFSMPLIGDVLGERENGVKELMKITGVKEWMLWLCWFLYGLLGTFISLIVVVFLVKLNIESVNESIINFSPFLVLWMFLFLYATANISFCFTIASLFQNSTIASVLYFFYSVGAFVASFYVRELPFLPYVAGLLPMTTYTVGANVFMDLEVERMDFDWSTFNDYHTKSHDTTLRFVFIMLIIDTLLYFILAWYITTVYPGKYGAARSPLFPLQSLFSRKKDDQSASFENPEYELDPRYFEPPPYNVTPTLQVINLHKHFASLHAVRGVNLTTYEGEITVLLGHNGAGKTTTMSILTGLTSPSSGSVYYKNIDAFENMDEFRYRLGFCPQDNRLFSYLSVMDHLLFFGQLKRLSKKEASQEAEGYLKRLNLVPQKNSRVEELSGGMKRKLNLSIAMMGKAEVLILDEPTAGMDTESRRSLWDVLMNLRGNRTMILSTHYMEEADALGDRIAIMNHGIIVCHGSPMFLKKAYDTGYELTVSKLFDNSWDIANLVRNALPSASLVSDSRRKIVFKLPLTETQRFPAMFQILESASTPLGIQNLGVTATTLEQVFLIAGGATAYDPSAPKVITQDADYGRVNGLWLFFQQLWTMLKKKFLFTIRDPTNVFVRIILPTILACLYLWATNVNVDMFNEPVTLSLSLYSGKTVLYQETDYMLSLKDQMQKYVTEKNNTFNNIDNSVDISKAINSTMYDNPAKYDSDYLSAYYVNHSCIVLMYSDSESFPHAQPVTIDTYYNVLLRTLYGPDKYSIETISQLVPRKPAENATDSQRDNEIKAECAQWSYANEKMIIWYFIFGVFTTDLLMYFSQFVSMERIDGFYHIQMMSRLSPFVYWLGTIIFDFIIFSIFMTIRIALFKIAGSAEFIGHHEGFYVLLLMLTLYGISGLLMTYVLSFLINAKDTSFGFFFCINVLTAFVTAFIHAKLDELEKEIDLSDASTIPSSLKFVWAIVLILPTPTYYKMFINFLEILQRNELCLHCTELFKPLCEALSKKRPYLNSSSFEWPSLTTHRKLEPLVATMLAQIVVYSIIIFLVSWGILDSISNMFNKIIFGSKSTRADESDNDVQLERSRVQEFAQIVSSVDYTILESDDEYTTDEASEGDEEGEEEEAEAMYWSRMFTAQYDSDGRKRSKRMSRPQNISLLVSGLRKNYIKWCSNFTSVSDASFMIERGKCFGLLGVNGAGKTTTFRMLTAEIIPTLGDAYIDGVRMGKNKRKYLSAAGYCSQTNCFIEQLTAAEMLMLIASFRGIRARDRSALVNKWISIIGLEEYKNRRCGNYSGGNKRKLCTAMSLIGNPKVVFLDEPTSGVDPVARRNLYDVMAQSRASGQTVVLTSHSMEECETLCDRLTIMVSGVMKCIGTVQHLKKRYAQGFSAMIKIFDSPTAEEKIPGLQRDIERTFSSITLKDEHPGLLYYQITDTSLLWSVLFYQMELLKLRNEDVMEDYVLTDTSLEEVFISFAQSGK